MEQLDTVVLGGGIAGLAAASEARRQGRAAIVFEAGNEAGGLLAPLVIDGFVFDTAVHLSFATEPEVRKVFDETPYLTHKPESWCYEQGYWLKHPVQNNLFPLPLDEKVALLKGLAKAQDIPVVTYRDWLVAQYGLPLAERYSLAYTEKYWTVPAERLGVDWVGVRMRQADLGEAIAGAISPETPNHYYVKEMRYPKQGGYGAFIRPLIEAATIRFDKRAAAVDAARRIVRFADGSEVTYRRLISTIPLPRLAEMLDAPATIRADSDTLFATSIDLISIGFDRPAVSPALWFYVYDRDIAAARAYSPDWKSPANVPEGCSALQFEIYSSPAAPQQLEPDELIENTIEGVVRMGLASRDDIRFARHHRVPYGNVVFDLGMEERRDRVRQWIEAQDIAVAGRFGEWKYLWSNQAFMSGLTAARDSVGVGVLSEAR